MKSPDSILMGNLKAEAFEYLKVHCLGNCQAIKAADLALSFHTNLRTINDVIRLLRKDGFLIGSSKSKHPGYYIPVTDQEIDDYLKDFKAEIFDMLETYNAQKRAKKKYLENRVSDDLFAGQDLYKRGCQREMVPAL